MPELYGSDAYSPGEVAERVEQVGVVKARLHAGQLFTLGVLAGGFIGMGGLFMTVVSGDTGGVSSGSLRGSPSRWDWSWWWSPARSSSPGTCCW
jgi:hypothetical protein